MTLRFSVDATQKNICFALSILLRKEGKKYLHLQSVQLKSFYICWDLFIFCFALPCGQLHLTGRHQNSLMTSHTFLFVACTTQFKNTLLCFRSRPCIRRWHLQPPPPIHSEEEKEDHKVLALFPHRRQRKHGLCCHSAPERIRISKWSPT